MLSPNTQKILSRKIKISGADLRAHKLCSVLFTCSKIWICLHQASLAFPFTVLYTRPQKQLLGFLRFHLFEELRHLGFHMTPRSTMEYHVSRYKQWCCLSCPAGSCALQVPAGEQHKASQENRIMHNVQTQTSKHSIAPLQETTTGGNYNDI